MVVKKEMIHKIEEYLKYWIIKITYKYICANFILFIYYFGYWYIWYVIYIFFKNDINQFSKGGRTPLQVGHSIFTSIQLSKHDFLLKLLHEKDDCMVFSCRSFFLHVLLYPTCICCKESKLTLHPSFYIFKNIPNRVFLKILAKTTYYPAIFKTP